MVKECLEIMRRRELIKKYGEVISLLNSAQIENKSLKERIEERDLRLSSLKTENNNKDILIRKMEENIAIMEQTIKVYESDKSKTLTQDIKNKKVWLGGYYGENEGNRK